MTRAVTSPVLPAQPSYGPLALGVDIVSKERIRLAVTRSGRPFVEHVFTPEEMTYCEAAHDPIERYAGFWAAKEAVAKTLGCGIGAGLGFHDIVIKGAQGRAPEVALHGVGATLAPSGCCRWLLSLSHNSDSAIAVAILVGLDVGLSIEAGGVDQ
jgi:holo-[acyl-carrier protein] synthase